MAGPRATTMAPSTSKATPVPSRADLHPLVDPTATTMVSASTISTALAKKTATTSTRFPLCTVVAIIVAMLAQARSPVESHHPGSGRFDQFVELFERVNFEQPVEHKKLQYPEDGERHHVGEQHHPRLLKVTQVMFDPKMPGDGSAEDGYHDADSRHRPEGHDLLHQMGSPVLAPHPTAIEVVRGHCGDRIGKDRAADLSPEVEDTEYEGESTERHHRGNHGNHGVADELLCLGSLPFLPQVFSPGEDGSHMALP